MATQLYTAAAASRTSSSSRPAATAASNAAADEDDEASVLRAANALLEKIGFGARQFAKFEDLVASVSSMSVALYEKLFQFRLEHIVRVPRSLADYEANAQLVVDALSGALLEQRFDVRDVTGESLCAGDTRSIQQIVRMFEQIFNILEEANSRGEQAHFATPPSRSLASGVSFSERKINVSHSVSMKPVKRLTKKKKNKNTRTSASRVQLTKSGLASDNESEGSSANEGGTRRLHSSRLEKEHRSRAARARHNLTGNANLYETSNVSITRSRGGDLSATRGRGVAIRQSEGVPSRSTRAAVTTISRAEGLTTSTVARQVDAGNGNNTVVAKKRSRRLNQSFKMRPQQQQQQQQQVDSAERRKAARSKMPKSINQSTQDANLLETQKYGRFVPVARQDAGPASSGSEADGDSSDSEFGGPGLGDDEQMYFGGVSSVSNGGSGSEKSVHFIEEDDEVSRDFASITDLQNVPPNAVHSPSNTYDDDRSARVKAPARVDKKSTNQEEAEGDEEEQKQEEPGDEPPNSPRPKRATKAQPTTAPELFVESHMKKQKDPASTLYPLLPRGGNAANSKSQTEFMRYKLYLKDHLQDLRQREYCQRQHLERAYKVGEHTANVEKIRARRFQQDIRLQRIAIGLEAKSEEEKHLRHTLTHILSLEKAKLRDEHRTTASILKQIQKDHAERESAMETFYANQIQLVKEQTHREVKERELVEKAHRLASEQMVREMRKEREHQIKALLQEKQHLEAARRFRSTTKLSSALRKEDDASARTSHTRVDAFYTAAMKARQHNATAVKAAGASAATSTQRAKQAAAAYSSVRPGDAVPLSWRVK